MHDIPDTEESDAAAEKLWPEGPFRESIRARLPVSFCSEINEKEAFKSVYEDQYADRFDDYQAFVARLAEIAVIGAENGADQMFDEIYASFRTDGPLPDARNAAKFFWPQPFTDELKKELHLKIYDEYHKLHAYIHIHEEHYQGTLSLKAFIAKIADLVIAGAVNGTDAAIGEIYSSFISSTPLPIARRRSRRAR
jgi:hypothetical protein